MNCTNCGTYNNPQSKFCIKCGNALNADNLNQNELNQNINPQQNYQQQAQPQMQQPINNVQPAQPQMQQPINNVQPTPTVNPSQQNTTFVDGKTFNFIKYIISFIIKPFETYKKEEGKLVNVKNGMILSGIVAGAMMIIQLLTSMISVIFVKTMDYSTFDYKTKIDFARLKDLDYLSLIGKNLLIYVCIILAITVVYYLASLVVKKSTNFIKTLSISASSIIPYVIMGMIVSPLLGKIWAPLSIVATIIGAIYSIIIFVLLINDNIKFDKKDMCAYFHLVCMTILSTAGYYVYMKVLTSGITNQISDYLNMFK